MACTPYAFTAVILAASAPIRAEIFALTLLSVHTRIFGLVFALFFMPPRLDLF